MTDRKKLKNIKAPKKKNLGKNNKIKDKFKKESNSMKLSNKLEEMLSSKDLKFNKINYFNKLLKKNRKEDLFYYNFKENNKKWIMLDKIIVKKYKNVKEKEDNNYKISKRRQDFIDTTLLVFGYLMIK